MKIYSLQKLSLEDKKYVSKLSKGHQKKIHMLKKFKGECYCLLCKEKIDGVYQSNTDMFKKELLFTYDECFHEHSNFYSDEHYEFLQCTPKHILKFYHYFVVQVYEFPNEWYRGELCNGNILLDIVEDTMERIVDTL